MTRQAQSRPPNITSILPAYSDGELARLSSVPPVARETGSTKINTLGKILDRKGLIPIDIARRINHSKIEIGPAPSPTAEYGRWIARQCSGCTQCNQWIAPAERSSCGKCKLLQGPIHPDGTCKAFAAKA